MPKFKDLTLATQIIIIVALVLVVCFIVYVGIAHYIASKVFAKTYAPDLIITSPDSQHELVVREWVYWSQGGAEIYIRKTGQDKWYNRWREKQIGTTSTDDLYQPFSSGDYYVEWESDKVTVYYYGGWPGEIYEDRSTWRDVITYEFE